MSCSALGQACNGPYLLITDKGDDWGNDLVKTQWKSGELILTLSTFLKKLIIIIIIRNVFLIDGPS